MIKAVIIEDEALIARELQAKIAAVADDVKIVETLPSLKTARKWLLQNAEPDLLFMDIQLSDGVSFELFEDFDLHCPVIFTTAYDEYALRAFKVNGIDYLLKPVRHDRLIAALDKARRMLGELPPPNLPESKQRTHLCARLRGSMRLIPITEVYYLQAEEKYVVIHHEHGEDLIEDSLKSLELEFSERFLRIHRNCLVATDEIIELRRAADGQTRARLRHVDKLLDVSRRCLPSLRKRVREL